MKKSKKAQMTELSTLGGLAVGIAVLGITLVIAFLVLSQGGDQATQLIDTETTTNETVIGWSQNGTSTAFTQSPNALDGTVACSAVWNGTAGGLVLSTNYTCDNDGIIFLGDNTSDGWNNSALITYTYKLPSYALNGTRGLANATDDIPGWVPLIIIAFIGSILLGLVAKFRSN